MKNIVVVIVVLGILALAFYLGNKSRRAGTPTETLQLTIPAEQEPKPISQKLPEPQPVLKAEENAPVVLPLPELDQSDGAIQGELVGLYDGVQLEKLFNFESAIRHFVVTIDNMTTAKLPQKFKFTRLPQDKFLVLEDAAGTEYIDSANYNRYTPYIHFIESLDLDKTVALYFKYYPLFQKAYAELGYPDRNFNDRLIKVVEHLLTTPEIQEPVKLLQPGVYYTFADAKLEALSAGQKLMIRIGQSNAVRVKSWLQHLHIALTAVR